MENFVWYVVHVDTSNEYAERAEKMVEFENYVYLARETIILMIGPEFDSIVWASFSDILEKSVPSMSSTLSIVCNFP